MLPTSPAWSASSEPSASRRARRPRPHLLEADPSAIIVGISVAYAALLARCRRYERTVGAALAATPMTGYAAVDEQSAAKVGV